MGLDMYISKKTYVRNWGFMKPEERHSVSVKRSGELIPHIKPERISYIEELVGEWRKANQIHAWFVQNVQDGEDDCREYRVDIEKLRELKEECKKAIENEYLAPEILPTASGFFFGSQEYDEYYFEDIQKTIDIIEDLETNDFRDCVDFYYQSSW